MGDLIDCPSEENEMTTVSRRNAKQMAPES